MSKLLFKQYMDNDSRKYIISCDDFYREFSEFETIEIMVSLLRARFEMEYLKERKPRVFQSTERMPLVVLKKEIYGLKVVLAKETITVLLFNSNLIEYTHKSFYEQCEMIYEQLSKDYGQGKIDYKIFSPIYLEHMLGVDIPCIEKVEYSKQNILSLFFYDRQGPKKVRITEHELFKQLQSGNIESGWKSTNHIFEDNVERIRNILSEVSDKPETYCAVVYGDEDVVRDGTHRLACMYYLYGDIEVPIIRVYVSQPFYSYTMYRAAMNNIEMDVIK